MGTIDRRTALKTGGMAFLGFGLGGCAAGTARPAATPAAAGPLRRPFTLPPVQCSWDRVIRTTVGLRPHRPSGFVLKAQKLDAKTVIHNYGHGGAGMSISWGTGQMAAEMALAHDSRRAAVLGCGAVGLTAARQLQRRGFDVTIYAASVPPDTTSNMSLAGFTPTSGLVEPDRRTAEWDAQFRRAAEISYRQLQLLAGPGYGISWIDNYNLSDELPRDGGGEGGGPPLLPDHLRTGRVILQPGEHPFPTKYASRSTSMRIEPSIYLDALVRDFLAFGGHLVIRTFDGPRDIMALNEPIVVNSTGLGAGRIFGDAEIMPVKGQLTLLVPQPEITYRTSGGARTPATPAGTAGPGGGGGIGIHMNPRSDGIALGGTSERGVASLDPNEEARRRVVEGHIQLFTAMRPYTNGSRLARFLEGRRSVEPPPLESFFGVES